MPPVSTEGSSPHRQKRRVTESGLFLTRDGNPGIDKDAGILGHKTARAALVRREASACTGAQNACSGAAQTATLACSDWRHNGGPDDYAEPAAADIPAATADVETGELSAAQLPQVLVMHDASDGSQVRSCSREPPRGDQCLGRSQDAHHDSMGTGGA